MKKIWIDLDNAPHVPFFAPIIDELKARGYGVVVTARNRFQVSELAKMHNIPHELIGSQYGKNRYMKMMELCWRALQLLPFVKRERPDLAISHGSRAQAMTAKLAGIPLAAMFDYEHAKDIPFVDYDSFITPDVIPSSVIKVRHRYHGTYPGIKEDAYVPRFRPAEGLLDELGIDSRRIIVLIRPPATEAHYQSPKSEALFRQVMDWVAANPETVMILLSRNERQDALIRETWPDLIKTGKLVIPEKAIDGLNLIWHSDLVISGGGTMNREAAALGVPVYSIFRGESCYVDRYLSASGRMTLIGSAEELRAGVRLEKWRRPPTPGQRDNRTLLAIVAELEKIVSYGEVKSVSSGRDPRLKSAQSRQELARKEQEA